MRVQPTTQADMIGHQASEAAPGITVGFVQLAPGACLKQSDIQHAGTPHSLTHLLLEVSYGRIPGC
jgi:hypothetical protein